MSDRVDTEIYRCDGCGLEREPVQLVDVYDGVEHYCIACAEVPP